MFAESITFSSLSVLSKSIISANKTCMICCIVGSDGLNTLTHLLVLMHKIGGDHSHCHLMTHCRSSLLPSIFAFCCCFCWPALERWMLRQGVEVVAQEHQLSPCPPYCVQQYQLNPCPPYWFQEHQLNPCPQYHL